MSKIVVMMSVGSHQNATFCLSRNLVKEGHTLLYAGAKKGVYHEDLSKNVTQQGFDYEIFDPFETIDENNTERDFTNEFYTFAENLLDGTVVTNFINKVNPDLILLDIHFPIYAIAFSSYNIPIVFLSTELLTERDLFNPPLTSSIIPRFDDISKYEISEAWDKIRKDIPAGVEHLISQLAAKNNFSLQELLSEKCIVLFGLKLPEIVLWPIEFEFHQQISFHQRVNHIGCYTDLNRIENSFDWTQINDNKPIIYAALGTVLNHEVLIHFIFKLVETAKECPEYEFIISTGRLFQKINQISVPENLHLDSYVPQIEVLKKSNLMITLGGANSLKECILHEVPMLCYPFHSDQFGNAARLSYHKLGLQGNILEDSSKDIRNKIQSILLDKEFNKRIHHFKRFFKFNDSEHRKMLLLIETEITKRTKTTNFD